MKLQTEYESNIILFVCVYLIGLDSGVRVGASLLLVQFHHGIGAVSNSNQQLHHVHHVHHVHVHVHVHTNRSTHAIIYYIIIIICTPNLLDGSDHGVSEVGGLGAGVEGEEKEEEG